MFSEEGWLSLAEVTADVFRRLQALQAAGDTATAAPDGKLRALLAVSVWDICDAATKIGVTGGDGQVIPASKDLVAWSDPCDLSNEHVNLVVGNVGSSTHTNADGKRPGRDALITRYGPFLGMPIVLPENNVQSSMTFLPEEVKKQRRDDPEVVEATRTILAAVERGEIVTREILRARMGAAMSRRKFKLAWAAASETHPKLAQPNRWAGL